MKDLAVIEQINRLIVEETDPAVLREKLREFHPYDLASAFLELDEGTRQKVYRVLDDQTIADIFEYLQEDETADFIEELNPKQGASVLQEMDSDDAIDVIQEIESDKLKSVLDNIEPEAKENLKYLSTHPENSAGSIMTTNFMALESHLDVKQAMKILIKEADESEVIDPLFVVENEKLVGVLDLKDLIIARSPLSINAIMKPNPVFVLVTDEAIDAVHKINDYGIGALPVLDQSKLVGIITIDDAMDVVHADATENFGMLAGYVTKPAEESSLKKSLLKRLPWLTILLLLSLLVSNVTKIFEGVIQQVTVLIFFQSLILDMAGNAGTQTLAVAIRSLEKNELDTSKNIRKFFFKEFRISLLDSFALAVFSFFICYFFIWSRGMAGVNIGIVSMIVSVSLFLSLLLSGLMASFLPVFFHRIGIDPSVASGPFITTMNDVFSTIIYFGLAFLSLSLI